MRNLAKAALVCAMLASIAIQCLAQGAGTTVTQSRAKDGVFIHVSSGPDAAHRVLMALKMADVMSADHDVMMYFDIKGVAVLVKDAPEVAHGSFESSKGMLQKLSAKGIRIEACPSCLTAAGYKPEDLVPGVKIADKKDFFGFTEGRILSLDY
jgi:predicted peroxiredoxin